MMSAGSFQIRRISRKPSQAGIGVCDSGSNGLIQFMGKRTGQLAKHGHSVHVREVCL